jgi:tripartite-type tricarboxylate transporter receptor subunit TctC
MTMRLAIRIARGLAALVVGSAVTTVACAQAWPAKPMRLVIGYAPGGVTDVINRIIAEEAGKRLGQAITVENRPGSAGLVAALAVRNSAPDGYTLLGGSLSGSDPIFLKEGIHAPKELTPVSGFIHGDWFLYVPTSIGVNNLRELAAYGKANAGRFRFSSPATTNTLYFTMVAKTLGVPFENIPYKDSTQTIAALLQGDGHVTFNAASGFDPHIQAGKLKAIATLSPQRSHVRPDVPTAREQGVDLERRFNIGMWGPLGLPREIAGRLHATIRESVAVPAVAERIRAAALTPTPDAPEEMLRELLADLEFFREAIALSGYQRQ